MISSMTGYGKAEQIIDGRNITLEIKSVNSRYFEYFSRMPRTYMFLDDKLKKLLSENIKRGKVELALTVQNIDTADAQIGVNADLAKGYYTAIEEISTLLGIPNSITADSMARFPDIIVMNKTEQDEDKLWQDIKSVAQTAIENFMNMRMQEGEKLKLDILNRIEMLENYTKTVESFGEERVKKHTEKLHARLMDVLQSTNIDEARILTEAAIFADKTAVDEETVRLYSHFEQYKDILKTGGAVGRKLDFLTQELNRETNTIGSKCNEIAITRTVVEMKSEIEKIREQVQNIE